MSERRPPLQPANKMERPFSNGGKRFHSSPIARNKRRRARSKITELLNFSPEVPAINLPHVQTYQQFDNQPKGAPGQLFFCLFNTSSTGSLLAYKRTASTQRRKQGKFDRVAISVGKGCSRPGTCSFAAWPKLRNNVFEFGKRNTKTPKTHKKKHSRSFRSSQNLLAC